MIHPSRSQVLYTLAIGVGLALAGLAWLVVDSDMEGDRPVPDTVYFSEDYATARDRFRRSVAEASGRLDSLALAAKGPDGDDLSIDIGWFGSESPRRVLLHVSGIHGVEAFAGSAIQLRLIENLPAVPEGLAVVFIHVLNPYGMAWLRRFNENNVDLNRNFLAEGATYQGRPDGYDDFYEFLNPSRLPTPDLFILRAGWLVFRHGMAALEAAIVSGQYDYPEGLFFGGRKFEQGPQLYTDFLVRTVAAARWLFAIDVHTGLGPFGEDTLLVSDHRYDRLRDLLGERVEAFSADENNVAYNFLGGHHEGVEALLEGVDVDFVGQEFGTYSQAHVLGALRKENYGHHYGDRSVEGPYKRDLRDAFYPDDAEWQRRVLDRGNELFKQVFDTMAAP